MNERILVVLEGTRTGGKHTSMLICNMDMLSISGIQIRSNLDGTCHQNHESDGFSQGGPKKPGINNIINSCTVLRRGSCVCPCHRTVHIGCSNKFISEPGTAHVGSTNMVQRGTLLTLTAHTTFQGIN